MKKYRILYWFNSITTEHYVRAINAEEAEKKFRDIKGDRKIIEIQEVE